MGTPDTVTLYEFMKDMSEASEAITKLGIPTPQALVSHRQALSLINYIKIAASNVNHRRDYREITIIFFRDIFFEGPNLWDAEGLV